MSSDGVLAIQTVNLSKSYPSGDNHLVIFADLNLHVAAGERLALVGESGTGKSTLLHLLGGLDRPTKGKILFGSKDITSLREAELAEFRNRDVGFVWQTHYLLPEFTAMENVMMPLLLRGIDRAQAVGPASEKLEQVGLAARAHHRSGELSGGEQQRVVLARALAGNPSVLLADEPTGSLDYGTGERIADLFDEVHRLNRLTSVFVTHNLRFARRCDRILKLERGSLIPVSLGVPSHDASLGIEEPNGAFVPLQRESLSEDIARGEDGTTYV